MDVLVEAGHAGLTIERLCKATGKTKGSFYHHFANIEAFRHRLLEHWQATHTQELIAATSGEEPTAALRSLARLTAQLPYAREAAFRVWANRDPQAATLVALVDQARVGHVAWLLQRLGHSEAEAHELAWFEYALFVGMAQLGLPTDQRRRLRDLLERKLL